MNALKEFSSVGQHYNSAYRCKFGNSIFNGFDSRVKIALVVANRCNNSSLSDRSVGNNTPQDANVFRINSRTNDCSCQISISGNIIHIPTRLKVAAG